MRSLIFVLFLSACGTQTAKQESKCYFVYEDTKCNYYDSQKLELWGCDNDVVFYNVEGVKRVCE